MIGDDDGDICRYSGTRAVVVAFVLTLFPIFNIPVFWPILVMYFIILFSITMKRQIMVCNNPVLYVQILSHMSDGHFVSLSLQHMIRYRYLPFSYGKRQYKGKETTVS